MAIEIRAARRGDEGTLFELVLELARFEHLEGAVTGSSEALAGALFGDRPAAEAFLAHDSRDARVLGYALFFTTYSTFLTRRGLYLEDLFVREAERGRGVGRALLGRVAAIAHERDAGRVEWAVLDWNVRAIGFYERVGASVLPDWRLCRIAPAGLARGTSDRA